VVIPRLSRAGRPLTLSWAEGRLTMSPGWDLFATGNRIGLHATKLFQRDRGPQGFVNIQFVDRSVCPSGPAWRSTVTQADQGRSENRARAGSVVMRPGGGAASTDSTRKNRLRPVAGDSMFSV